VHIRTFRIVNYKCFADSGEIHLQPGFNVIVGRNNVGKTALAEAVGLHFPDKPNRSLRTVTRPNAEPDPASWVEVSIRVEVDELTDLLVREIPRFSVATLPESPAIGQAWFGNVASEGAVVEAVVRGGNLLSARLSVYPEPTPQDMYTQFAVDPSGNPTPTSQVHGTASDYPELATVLAQKFLVRLYSFSAIRFSIDESSIGTNRVLAPNAADLVQVLDLLSRNPRRWQRYFEKVRTILPEIEAITFLPSDPGGGRVRALLWNIDLGTEREDLAVSLSESGTGVGQVLAILYVVFTSEYPRTIVIDEPQSFLHPGAVRKLFEILKSYPQHQYVITTHSPNAVTAADPEALFMVHKEGEESVVDELDVSETRDQARFLREVGASLSDVFGADNVLWVEGATEEECFPLILSEVAGRPLLGTKIVGVLSTGNLEGKRSRDAYRIYQRLTEAGGLVPPAVGFIFDREERDKIQRDDLERESGGLVAFTSRRMFENYLLNPRAIAHVASHTEGFSEDGDVSLGDIEGWIEEHRWDDKYFDPLVEELPRTHHFWLAEVDGAQVLKDLFASLSESRVAYDKVLHGVELTRWLCDNAPEDLEELASLIKDRLDHRVSREDGTIR
jgi:hypothetical protein